MKERLEVQAVVRRGNQILIVKKDIAWRLPKGGIELNETHLQALKRELKEEINLQHISAAHEYYHYNFELPNEKHIVTVFEVVTDQITVTDDKSELSDTRWVEPLNAIDMLYFAEEKECVKQYLRYTERK